MAVPGLIPKQEMLRAWGRVLGPILKGEEWNACWKGRLQRRSVPLVQETSAQLQETRGTLVQERRMTLAKETTEMHTAGPPLENRQIDHAFREEN